MIKKLRKIALVLSIAAVLFATCPVVATGAVSISTQEVASDFTFIKAGALGTAAVQCPAGTVVTGGGFHFNTLGPYGDVVHQNGRDGNGWKVQAYASSSPNGVNGGDQLFAFAECATIHP